MGFTVSSLTNYTNENAERLIRKSLLENKTAKLVNIYPGVKSSETINIFETLAEFQAGSSCGFNSSGATTFTQRTITIGKIKVNEQFCPKDLETKYLQKALTAGSHYETIPYEQEITEMKAQVIAQTLELADWRGDTASGDNRFKHYDGFIKLIDDAGTAVAGNTSSATSITTSNARTIFNNMYNVIPAEILDKEDLAFFCGWDTFRKLVINITNDNLYHFVPEGSANGEMVLPGTNVKVYAVHGLDSTNRIFCGRTSNFYIGVDLANEEEKFRMWYSQDDDVVKFAAELKRGTQVAFPNEIVEFTLS